MNAQNESNSLDGEKHPNFQSSQNESNSSVQEGVAEKCHTYEFIEIRPETAETVRLCYSVRENRPD